LGIFWNRNIALKMNHRQQLCKTIEAALHQEIRTPKDFDQLRERIFLRLHQHVLATTLKRVWGYLDNESGPSVRTLDILAQFVGYENYQAFCSQSPAEGPEPSNLAMNRHLDVMTDLAVGEDIALYWLPDRICRLRYVGDMRFVVTASENTRLKPGDFFCCSIIIEGEPLYLSQLHQGDLKYTNYVSGKRGGIRYELKRDK
jgi:hypothetical protein